MTGERVCAGRCPLLRCAGHARAGDRGLRRALGIPHARCPALRAAPLRRVDATPEPPPARVGARPRALRRGSGWARPRCAVWYRDSRAFSRRAWIPRDRHRPLPGHAGGGARAARGARPRAGRPRDAALPARHVRRGGVHAFSHAPPGGGSSARPPDARRAGARPARRHGLSPLHPEDVRPGCAPSARPPGQAEPTTHAFSARRRGGRCRPPPGAGDPRHAHPLGGVGRRPPRPFGRSASSPAGRGAMTTIESVRAREILDSRGQPTVEATVVVAGGAAGWAAVPSGASTGAHEAVELRDGDARRYAGKGVLRAVGNVNDVLGPGLRGLDVGDQTAIDARLVALDGTPNKARLGANAILAVSLACARDAAAAAGRPLYRALGSDAATLLPVPLMNVINGGRHATNPLDFQEFMIVPHGASSFHEATRQGVEVYHVLRGLLDRRGFTTAVGDEGGFAPALRAHEEALDLLVEAIGGAGLTPGRDVSIALDAAASELAADGGYVFHKAGGRRQSADELIALYSRWASAYPLVSIEDGLGEDDWEGWQRLTAALGDRLQLVGDDIFVTNERILARGIAERVANAVLIKLNQIGTVTETRDTMARARGAGYRQVVSHRSGETEDAFIADFAVATGAGQIKTGAPCRSERTAKYNRLLAIAEELGAAARYVDPFARRLA